MKDNIIDLIKVALCNDDLDILPKLTDNELRILDRKVEQVAQEITDTRVCQWTVEVYNHGFPYYTTACGQSFEFIEGGITENNFKFCHGCGATIEEVK